MGRQPCCEKVGLKKGPWSVEEDRKLVNFITSYGHSCWREVPKLAGLLRCGKSCRLRWTNYLRPDLKRGQLSDAEEKLIIDLHAAIGNRWSRIAAQLPGRTDNEIKNYWNTRIKKKLKHMGIDPVTHKPLSELTSSDSTHQKRKSNKIVINNNNIHNISSHKGPLKSEVSYIQEDTNTVDSCISKDTVVLSKKEKLELESREAHMRVQKMKEALYAFNSRFSNSPSTFISSPTSVITLAHKSSFEDLDESLLCEKPVVARDTSIDNFLSPRRSSSIVSHHKLGAPFFPFSHVAQEARPLSNYINKNVLGEINCGLYEKHFLDRNQEENNHLHDQRRPLDSFAFDCQQPLLNDWLKAQRDSTLEISQEAIHVGASEWSPSAPHHTAPSTQEASSCPWIKVSLGLQDHILPTTTMHVPSQESSFTSSSTFSFPPSSCLDASSWNSMMQQFLEDSSIPCGILDSQVMTTTGVASSTSGLANFAASSMSSLNNFAPSELQRLALLLDEI